MWSPWAAAVLPLLGGLPHVADWHAPGCPGRLPVTVDAGFYDRDDALVRLPLETDRWLAALGDRAAGGTDPVRVVEVTEAGRLRGEAPWAVSPEGNELRWVMAGHTEALAARHFQVYFGASSRLSPPAVRPNVPPLPPADNLLLNPGFEEAAPDDPGQASHWEAETGEGLTVERTDEEARSGRWSLKLTNGRGGETAAAASQRVAPLLPAKRYLVCGWVRIAECESGSVAVTCWYSAREGQKAPGNYKSQAGTQGVGGWLKAETTGIIYYDAEHGEHVFPPLTLECTGGGRFELGCYYGLLTAYFDDVRLVEASRDVLAPVTVSVGPLEKRP